MTSTQELRNLIAQAEARGATITTWIDEEALRTEGREIIATVRVIGAGCGPFPMGAIAAAEALRNFLAN